MSNRMNLIDTKSVSRENIMPLKQPFVVAPAFACEESLGYLRICSY
jgi:hypothetical protein